MNDKDDRIVDGVAYDVPIEVAQKFRYIVSTRSRGCAEEYLASNSLRKVKEAMRARWMRAGWITRTDNQEFVLSVRGGRQVLHDSLPYAPRYGTRSSRRIRKHEG